MLKPLVTTCFLLLFSCQILSAQHYPFHENDFSGPVKISNSFPIQAPLVQPGSALQRSTIDPELAMTFDSILQYHYAGWEVTGLSAAVNIAGELWTGVKGNSSSTDTVNAEMAFAIGSVSKTLTSACILQMYEEGLLDLDDILYDFLPVYENIDSSITIRQLLIHTSGIYNFTNHPSFFDSVFTNMEKIWLPEEILEEFVLTPDFSPGASWNYSNTNYLLLGMIIETVSGNTYHEEVRSRLLEPLGLSSVSLPPFEAYNAEPVHLWFDAVGSGNSVDATALGLSLDALYSAAWAAGAYVSTPADMTVWARNLYNGSVLDQATLEELQTTFPFGTSTGYLGYGLGVLELGGTCYDAWGHGGDIIYSSQVYSNPDIDLSIAVHCNDGKVNSNDLIALVDELSCAYSEITNVKNFAKEGFSLNTNPNPFSEELRISYELFGENQVSLEVYNSLGQLIYQENQINPPAGPQTVEINDLTEKGMYFITLRASQNVYTKKVIRK